MLTLAGCGLHPYPPLLSLPGARQWRQASGDGENKGKWESKRESGAEILKSVILEKAFILSSSLYLHFINCPHCNSSSNMCIEFVFECMHVCVCVCVFIRGKSSISFSLMRVDTVSRGYLFTYVQCSLPFSVLPFLLPSSVCSIWKCLQWNCTNIQFSAWLFCLSLLDMQRQ